MGPRRDKKVINEVSISEFKADCSSLLSKVSETRVPLRITRRGKPIADVIPPSPVPAEKDWLGWMSDSVTITGDIISPVIEIRDRGHGFRP